MRHLGSVLGLVGLVLAGGSLYALPLSSDAATAPAPAVDEAFARCTADEPASSEAHAARQAIRSFLADRAIDGRFRTAESIGQAVWTGRYLPARAAYRIDVAVRDHHVTDAVEHRHYAYLVNIAGCAVRDRESPDSGA